MGLGRTASSVFANTVYALALIGLKSSFAFAPLHPLGGRHVIGRVMVAPSRSALALVSPAQNEKIQVAIIGGGVAGLSCAQSLSSSGAFDCTVFDTGRLRPGGRCSSRMVGDFPKEGPQVEYPILSRHIVDHAAQILSVPDKTGYQDFQKQVDEWEKQGIITRFPKGTVAEITANQEGDKRFHLKQLNSDSHRPLYYGSCGMGSIPLALAKAGGKFQIEQDVWVSPSNGVRYVNGQRINWKIQANGKVLGCFDRIVIAHNGKCADRLMSKTPAKELHSLLRVNFSPSVPKWGGNRMTLNSIYSLTIALPRESSIANALPESKFTSGFVNNEPAISFISSNTRKFKTDQDDVEVWTILSSATFGKNFKASQENLPLETISNVTTMMLNAVERSLDLPAETLSKEILESRLQLWGAAVPLNVWKPKNVDSSGRVKLPEGFVYDAEFGVGVCGDWLLEPSIAGAWESGRRLARFMQNSISSNNGKQSVGLPPSGEFRASNEAVKAGIGALR